MNRDYNAPPFNPLPVIVWILALPIIAMEVVINLGERGIVGGPQAIGWRLDAIERFAFRPDLMRYMLDTGTWTFGGVARFVTYPLVHGNFTHTLFVLVFLLALGKMVGEVFRPWAVAAVFFASAMIGALAYGWVEPRIPLFGGYPAVYGMIGAFTFLMWVRLAATGGNRNQAFTLIGMLLGIQLIFAALFGTGWEWIADVVGFTTGFFLSFVVSPGGFARVRDRLRQR